MLQDFFNLNAPFETFKNEGDLEAHFKTASNIENVFYEPACWPSKPYKIVGKTFKNVSLAKTKFSKVTFQGCHFEDCLIIGSKFSEVEFHRCSFKNCNFYKSEFSNSYLDPETLYFDPLYKNTHANIGVGVFQQLLDNSSDQHQSDFSMAADIQFRRWQRSQLRRELKVANITKPVFALKFLRNLSFDWLAGYGYRPFKFFFWTLILFFLISAINYTFLNESFIISGETSNIPIGLVDAIYYTFSILTVLGFSTVIPITAAAKIVTVVEALAAIGWLGIFTSVIVKRFIR